MSRAFVINGDEWGYCKEYRKRCSSAFDDGTCMRTRCKDLPEERKPLPPRYPWEKKSQPEE